jgi:hypothetical protein|tara:strand:- start:157 stop:417 length:261 start_codon:yes stop_codon:yes gene_type:complete
MKIDFTDKELRAMEYLARSRNYKVWKSIYEKMIADLVDIRNIDGVKNLDVEAAGRKRAAEIIEKELLYRLKSLSQEYEASDPNEYS